ncbi:MAG: hypothetical protein FJY07_11060, partial [Bacteroidetes bacterium]|nr:hypothetical protein [Bacteroidota bacterium]
MITKICANCNNELMAKRKDKKFCNSTCRSEHWFKSKERICAETNFQNQIRGLVPDGNNSVITSNPPKIFTREFLDSFTSLIEKNGKIKKLDEKLKILQTDLENLINEVKSPCTFLGAGTGIFLGFASTHRQSMEPKIRMRRTLLGGLGGLVVGVALDEATKENREKHCRKEIQRIKQEMEKLNASKTFLQKEIDSLKEAMNSMEKYTVADELTPVSNSQNKDIKGEQKTPVTTEESAANVSKYLHKPIIKVLENNSSDKVISSIELASMAG